MRDSSFHNIISAPPSVSAVTTNAIRRREVGMSEAPFWNSTFERCCLNSGSDDKGQDKHAVRFVEHVVVYEAVSAQESGVQQQCQTDLTRMSVPRHARKS